MSFSLQGLASGLDTSEIITKLMDVERVPYKNMETKKTQLQNQQAVFRQLNTKLNAMQLAASELRYTTAYNKNTANLSTNGIVSASANEAAIKGSYEIEVKELAKNGVATIEGINGNIKKDEAGSIQDYVFTFTADGKTSSINVAELGNFKDNKTALEAVVSKINKNTSLYGGRANLIDLDGKGNYALSITTLNGKDPVSISVNQEGYSIKEAEDGSKTFKLNGGNLNNFTFNINGEEVKISDLGSFATSEEALEQLAQEINSDPAKYGVNASLNDDNELVLTSTDEISLSVTNQDSASNYQIKQYAGQDAKLLINGIEITRPTNEVKGAIDGVTLNLSSVGSTTLTVGRDSAAVASTVDKFVTAYNDLIELINTNLAKPEGEDQINPLQGDALLKSLKDTLYNVFNEIVPASVIKDGSGKAGVLEQIGLSIDKNVTSSNQRTGKITFDQSAFKTALNDNFDKVMNMLIDRTEDIWKTMNNGYAGATKGLIASRISGYDTQIKTVDERLEALERSLSYKEERLKAQFNAMEVMMSSLSGTQNWLTSQINSLTA